VLRAAVSVSARARYRTIAIAQGASKKKEKENKEQKNSLPKKQPTDFPVSWFFFFFKVPLASAVGRLWTCHRMWAPATGCGVFLYELVPSDDPFMWCLCDTFFSFFFADIFYFFNGHFFLSEQEIKFVITSTTTAAVQSKSNSHVTIYYQPVEFTFCVFAVLFLIFEEEEVLP
jgi:hypothetical protein